jgi:hypothetical protein
MPSLAKARARSGVTPHVAACRSSAPCRRSMRGKWAGYWLPVSLCSVSDNCACAAASAAASLKVPMPLLIVSLMASLAQGCGPADPGPAPCRSRVRLSHYMVNKPHRHCASPLAPLLPTPHLHHPGTAHGRAQCWHMMFQFRPPDHTRAPARLSVGALDCHTSLAPGKWWVSPNTPSRYIEGVHSGI